jgi:macrolide transport system ATP-binding/permease protein
VLSSLLFRLRAVFGRRAAERNLDDELQAHLDHEVEKLRRAGMAPDEATRTARLALGGIEQVKEDCRDAWGTRGLDDLHADVRYAVRSQWKTPVFAITAILTLAVGIGANTGLFTLINVMLLRPTPVKEPRSLYELRGRVSRDRAVGSFSLQEYRDIEEFNTVFSQIVADSPIRARTNGRTFTGYLVSGNYFTALGGGTVVGRPIGPEDAKSSAPPVVVLDHAVWQSVFAGDAQIVGRPIEFAGIRFTVIGVAAPGFTGFDPLVPGFWAPISCKALLERARNADDRFLRVVGRVKTGVTPRQAELAMSGLLPQISRSRPPDVRFSDAELLSRATYQSWDHASLANVIPILTAFGLILLIACANLGNILFARALSRQREIGLRVALGASRSRVVRQLVTESAVLGICAGMVGLTLSQLTWTVIRRVITSSLSAKSAMSVVDVSPDYRVFAFTIVLSLMAGVLLGLMPALHATRSDLGAALKAEGSPLRIAVRSSRFRDGLVVTQFSLSLVLLIGAGLLLRSGTQFQAVDPGFDVSRVVGVLTVHGPGDADPDFQRRLAEQLSAFPGVAAVAFVLREPLRGALPKAPASVPNGPSDFAVGYNEVSPDYFAVLGIPLLRGRVFTDQETSSGAPVTVVSQSTARRLWPGQDPIGRTIRISTALFSAGGGESFQRTPQTVQVVGVAKDVVSAWIWNGPDETCVYLPTKTSQLPYYSILVRGSGAAKGLLPGLRAKVDETDRTLEFDVRTMEEAKESQVLPFRLASWGAAAIGALGLLLASIGIYGVMAFAVSQRVKEIAIRIALGASRANLIAMMLRKGGRLIVTSLACGLVLALGLSRVLGAMIFRVPPLDPMTFAAASLLLGFVGVLATLIPSVRACLVNANAALKYE